MADLVVEKFLLLSQLLLLLLFLCEILTELLGLYFLLLDLLHDDLLDPELQRSHPPLLPLEAGLLLGLLLELAFQALVGTLQLSHLLCQLILLILHLDRQFVLHLVVLSVRLVELLRAAFDVLLFGVELFIKLASSPLSLCELCLVGGQLLFLGVKLLLDLLIGFLELALELDSLPLLILKLKMDLLVIFFEKLGHVVGIFGFLLRTEPLLDLSLQLPLDILQRRLNHHLLLLELELLCLNLLVGLVELDLRLLLLDLELHELLLRRVLLLLDSFRLLHELSLLLEQVFFLSFGVS